MFEADLDYNKHSDLTRAGDPDDKEYNEVTSMNCIIQLKYNFMSDFIFCLYFLNLSLRYDRFCSDLFHSKSQNKELWCDWA